MKKLFFICFVLLTVFGSGCSTKSQKQDEHNSQKPNVLFIAIDDLNDWLGCFGSHPQAITPNIDQLAREGVLFTNAHCQSPICQPSRSSLLSGLNPTTTGMQYFVPRNFKQDDSFKNRITLTEYFSQNGYYTMGVGKVSHKGIPELYDEFGGHGSAGPRRDENNKLSYPMGHPLWDWGAFPEKDSQLPDYKSTMWAIDQLKRDFEKPFLLAVGYHRPHVPLYVPQKWFDLYPLEEIHLPYVYEDDLNDISDYALDLTYGSHAPRHQWMVENNQWHHAVQAYLACVTFVDHYVGELLKSLKESKYADNTIIVLWSDHGFHLGEKLRWEKRSLWDESTRIPLIFAGPGISENEICAQPVGLIDLYPTLNDLCGLPSKEGLEGISLKPLLKNPDMEWNRPAITSLGPDSHSVRTGEWRFILYGDGSMELYNHLTDPNEWHNMAYLEEYSIVIEGLKDHLPKYSKPLIGDSFDSGTLTLY
jgi:choline-sulfatase